MSRKHNVKKQSRSNYTQRLADRGLSRAPVMPTLESLRNRQPRRHDYNEKKSAYPGLNFNQKGFSFTTRGAGQE